jgi:hypothetical protein
MHLVYKNSYCNISATAVSNSTNGLFFKREPHHLWEDEINLNTEGIPGGQGQPIQRYTILDLSFWERNVDDAPVNRRAWVLQAHGSTSSTFLSRPGYVGVPQIRRSRVFQRRCCELQAESWRYRARRDAQESSPAS